ncbi:MAG: hypothetical protein H0X24_02605 [Ktedonobacterales bacterium]|nr:hypothetical protein [Ktedonobacterales bacterium]
MQSSAVRWLATFVGIVLGASLLGACGRPPMTVSPTVTLDATTKLFLPFITAINPNTTVIFKNADAATHTLKTVPNADPTTVGGFLNPGTITQSLNSGQQIGITFTTPGLYDLYDDTQATIDPTYHRVKANNGTVGFPYAPEAVVWVRGNPPGKVAPDTKNSVIAGVDGFQYQFTALQYHGTLTLHNYDTDKHYASDPGTFEGVNPTAIGNSVNVILGTDDAPPDGGDTPLTFYVPGLYYYYCTAHANFNTQLQRAIPHKDASLYPIVMESFVLVVQ